MTGNADIMEGHVKQKGRLNADTFWMNDNDSNMIMGGRLRDWGVTDFWVSIKEKLIQPY